MPNFRNLSQSAIDSFLPWGIRARTPICYSITRPSWACILEAGFYSIKFFNIKFGVHRVSENFYSAQELQETWHNF